MHSVLTSCAVCAVSRYLVQHCRAENSWIPSALSKAHAADPTPSSLCSIHADILESCLITKHYEKGATFARSYVVFPLHQPVKLTRFQDRDGILARSIRRTDHS